MNKVSTCRKALLLGRYWLVLGQGMGNFAAPRYADSEPFIIFESGRGVKLSAAEERDRRLAKKDGKKNN